MPWSSELFFPAIHKHASRFRLPSSLLSSEDESFLEQAIACAQMGFGHTFPNPAVGCVLVQHQRSSSISSDDDDDDDDDDSQTTVPPDVATTIIGRGFHPRAGWPHAEVFALLEAAGHVDSGVAAAQAVLDSDYDKSSNDDEPNALLLQIQKLSQQYASDTDGPAQLFGDCFANNKTTMSV